MAKSKFLKNLLTTASALAVLTCGVQGSYAGDSRETTGFNLNGVAVSSTSAHWIVLGGHLGVAINAPLRPGDDITILHELNITLVDGLNSISAIKISDAISYVDLSAKTLLIEGTMTLGSVEKANRTKAIKLQITDDKTLTLTGTKGVNMPPIAAADTYTGLADITIGSTNFGNNATLNLVGSGGDLTLAGNIDGSGNEKGILNVFTNVKTAKFSGNIGDSASLAEINVGGINGGFVANGIAEFTEVVNSKKIVIGALATTAAGGAGDATFKGEVTVGDDGLKVGGNAVAGFVGGDGEALFGADVTIANGGLIVGGDSVEDKVGGTGKVGFVDADLTIAAGGLKVGGKGADGDGGGAAAGANATIDFDENSDLKVDAGDIILGGNGGDGDGNPAGGGGSNVADASKFAGEVKIAAGDLKMGGDGGAASGNGSGKGGDGGAVGVGTELKFGKVVTLGAGKVIIGGKGGDGNGATADAVGGAGGAAKVIFDGGLKADNIEVGGAGGAGGGAGGGGANGGNGGDGTVRFNKPLTAANGTGKAKVLVGGLGASVGAGGADGTGGVGAVTFDRIDGQNVVHLADVTFQKTGSVTESVVNVFTAKGGDTNTLKVTGDFDFANTNGIINLGSADNKIAIIDGKILSDGGANGTLNIKGKKNTVTDAVGGGDAGKAVATIVVGNGSSGAVNFEGAVHAKDIKIGGDDDGRTGEATFKKTLNADTIKVGGITHANAVGTATFHDAVKKLDGGAAKITIGDVGAGSKGTAQFLAGDSIADVTFEGTNTNSSVTIGNGDKAAKVTGEFKAVNAGNKIILYGSTSGATTAVIDGKVVAGTGGDGAVFIKGHGKITGAVGDTTGYKVSSIQVGDGGVKGIATFDKEVAVITINIGAKGDAVDTGTGVGGNGAEGTANFTDKVVATTINIGGDGVDNESDGGDGTATFATDVVATTIKIGGNAGGDKNGGKGVATFGKLEATTVNVGTKDGADGEVTYGGETVAATVFGTKGSVVVVKNGVKLTGAVTAIGGGDVSGDVTIGILKFEEAGEVDGAIGLEEKALGEINTVKGIVKLGGTNAVFAKKIVVGGEAAIVRGDKATTVGTGEGAGVVFEPKTSGGSDGEGEFKIGEAKLKGDFDFAGQTAAKVVVSDKGSIDGAVDNRASESVAGMLKFEGAGKVTGLVGATNMIKLIDNLGVGLVTFDKEVNAETLKITNTELVTITGSLTTGSEADQGVIFGAGGKLTLGGAGIKGKFDFKATDGVIDITHANAFVKAKIVSDGEKGTLNFKVGNATIEGSIGEVSEDGVPSIGIKEVVIGGSAGATLNFQKGVYVAKTFDFAHKDSVINLQEEGVKLYGNVNAGSSTNPLGIIKVNESATIMGNVGSSSKINKIEFTEDGKMLTVDSSSLGAGILASEILFSKDGTLAIRGEGEQKIKAYIKGKATTNEEESSFSSASSSSAFGNVIVKTDVGDNNVTFEGGFGESKAPVKMLHIESGVASVAEKYVTLTGGDSNIHTIKLGKTNLMLKGNHTFTSIEEAHGSDTDTTNKGVANLIIGNAELQLHAQNSESGASVGTEKNKLQALVFSEDNILSVGDGVNIYADSLKTKTAITSENGAKTKGLTAFVGELSFKGNAIFDVKMTASDKIKKLSGPIEGVAQIKKEVHVAEDIIVGSGTLAFADNVNATNIYSSSSDGSKLKFINNNSIKVAGLVGKKDNDSYDISTIEFGGNDVTFKEKLSHTDKKFLFTSKEFPTKVSFDDNTNVGDANVEVEVAVSSETSEVDITNKLLPTIITSKTDKIEFSKKVTGNVEYNLSASDKAVAIIKSTELAGASFTTANDKKNDVIFDKDGAKVKDIGRSGKNMKKVTFSSNGQVIGDIYSENIMIDAGKTAKFGGVVGNGLGVFKLGTTQVSQQDSSPPNSVDSNSEESSSENTSSPQDTPQSSPQDTPTPSEESAHATAVFADGFVLNRKITAQVAGKGIVNFEGTATIGAEITGVNSVNFEADGVGEGDSLKDVDLNDDIKAKNISFLKSKVNLNEQDVTLEGKTKATGTDFYLDNKTLKIKGLDGGLTLAGNIEIHTTVSEEGTSGGNIKIDAGDTSSLADLSVLTVVIEDAKFDPVNNPNVTFVVIDNRKGSTSTSPLSIDKINVISSSEFTNWIQKVDDKNTVSFSAFDDSKNVLESLFEESAVEDKDNSAVLASDSDTRQELRKMDNVTRKQAVERIVATDVEAVVSYVVTLIGSDIGARMGNLAGIQAPTLGSNTIVTSDATSGISAGDDVSKYGIWTTPFFNKSGQKSRERSAGYDATTGGASFGFDTRANEDMIIGAAFSVLNSDVKHKDHKSGDKTQLDSLMFSIYGMQQIDDNWFAQSVSTFGSNRIKTNEKRINSNTTSQTAQGKYNSMAFSGEVLIGYNYSNGMVAVTPMGGIRATRINDGGYKETGTTNQNLTIYKKASNKFEIVLGGRISGGTFDLGGLVITPHVHGFVAQDLIGKNPKMDMRLDNSSQSFNTKRAAPNKTSYNVGVGMNARFNMMEYGLGYDAHLANKFFGQQGTLKVRVNF